VKMEVGDVDLGGGRRAYCLFNWSDEARPLAFSLSRGQRVRELWTGEDLGTRSGQVSITVPPRGGRVFICA
jgi:hypothetical protein